MTPLILALVAANIAAILFAGSKYGVTHRAEQKYWRDKLIQDSAQEQHPHAERADLDNGNPRSHQVGAIHQVQA